MILRVVILQGMRPIPERLLNVLNDYRQLTSEIMSPEVEAKFFEDEAVGRLSMHPSPLRIKAGKLARKEKNNGGFTLSTAEWIDSLYDLSERNSNRVWVTRGGFKFHENRNCTALAEGQSKANEQGKDTYNPQFVEREEAIRFGKKPCLVCKPKARRG
jgi:hypothetical protein